METKYEEIFNFLCVGEYPPGYNNSQKICLKKNASKFSLNDGDLFFGHRRVIKSKEEAKRIFWEIHLSPIGHIGIKKTRSAMSSRYYWRGMTIDIDNWVLECDNCQKVKIPLASSQPLKVSGVWEFVGIDIMGPLPKTVNEFQYILTAIDYFSKWVEAFPLKTKSAEEVAQHICSMIYRHGCPKRILCNKGIDFMNEINYRMCSLLQIERWFIAHNPQNNGPEKITNYNIKRTLTKFVNEKQNNWDDFLEPILFSFRSKVHTTTKYSPFRLMYGREAVYPSEVPVNLPLGGT